MPPEQRNWRQRAYISGQEWARKSTAAFQELEGVERIDSERGQALAQEALASFLQCAFEVSWLMRKSVRAG